MHFIDFLLQIICFICWALKTIYLFSFEYLIPAIGYVLPVLTKYLSQLVSSVLRVFFTYISPCIIQVLKGTTYFFTKAIELISVASMTVIDSDVNLEYAHAIIMISILILIIYFNITKKIFQFAQGWFQMVSLYFQFALNLLKMMRFCLTFLYKKFAGLFFSKHHHDDDEKLVAKTGKRQSASRNGDVNGNVRRSNGSSSHRPKEE